MQNESISPSQSTDLKVFLEKYGKQNNKCVKRAVVVLKGSSLFKEIWDGKTIFTSGTLLFLLQTHLPPS